MNQQLEGAEDNRKGMAIINFSEGRRMLTQVFDLLIRSFAVEAAPRFPPA
jgi:hypothetical protein